VAERGLDRQSRSDMQSEPQHARRQRENELPNSSGIREAEIDQTRKYTPVRSFECWAQKAPARDKVGGAPENRHRGGALEPPPPFIRYHPLATGSSLRFRCAAFIKRALGRLGAVPLRIRWDKRHALSAPVNRAKLEGYQFFAIPRDLGTKTS
jgi:hypothetical protein